MYSDGCRTLLYDHPVHNVLHDLKDELICPNLVVPCSKVFVGACKIFEGGEGNGMENCVDLLLSANTDPSV